MLGNDTQKGSGDDHRSSEESRRTYAEVMASVKSQIRFSELGIREICMKRAVIGGIILEIPGEDTRKKANDLAARLKEIFPDERDMKVKKAELRLRTLGDMVTSSNRHRRRLQHRRRENQCASVPFPQRYGHHASAVSGHSV